jgi:hypothetical protein
MGAAFGDGLRCAGGSVQRLGIRLASGGSASFGAAVPGDPLVSVQGSIPPTGATLYYQCWYRNAAVFCTAFTFNLSNGLVVTWSP